MNTQLHAVVCLDALPFAPFALPYEASFEGTRTLERGCSGVEDDLRVGVRPSTTVPDLPIGDGVQ